jgi:uncharacterized membrane protein
MLSELLTAFVVVTICLTLHIACLFLLAEWLIGAENKEKLLGPARRAFMLSVMFLVLIITHVLEAGIFAGFYYQRSLFPDFESSLYFSIGSYTTIGYGDLVLPRAWRLLGGIEGLAGVLLCGLSTAFVFAVVNAMFQKRLSRRNS